MRSTLRKILGAAVLAGAILVVLHIAFSASAFAANDARDRHITSAATRPESITVVVASDYPPYSIGSGAALQGILKDNWDLWSARTGITVNLQAIDWAEAQQAVLEGRADVIDMFFWASGLNGGQLLPVIFHRLL